MSPITDQTISYTLYYNYFHHQHKHGHILYTMVRYQEDMKVWKNRYCQSLLVETHWERERGKPSVDFTWRLSGSLCDFGLPLIIIILLHCFLRLPEWRISILVTSQSESRAAVKTHCTKDHHQFIYIASVHSRSPVTKHGQSDLSTLFIINWINVVVLWNKCTSNMRVIAHGNVAFWLFGPEENKVK